MTVFLIAAITVDGLIAQDERHISTTWTSREDKVWFEQRTKQAGVMLMGRATFETFNRTMRGRHIIVLTKDVAALQAKNGELVQPLAVLPEHETTPPTPGVFATDQDPKIVLEMLKNKKYSEVAICGGSSVYSYFLSEGLIDEMYLTIEPKLFGKGLGLLNQKLELDVTLLDVKQLAPSTLMVHYAINR